jgi:hypothetical protein
MTKEVCLKTSLGVLCGLGVKKSIYTKIAKAAKQHYMTREVKRSLRSVGRCALNDKGGLLENQPWRSLRPWCEIFLTELAERACRNGSMSEGG